jgi:hypothetical protein
MVRFVNAHERETENSEDGEYEDKSFDHIEIRYNAISKVVNWIIVWIKLRFCA